MTTYISRNIIKIRKILTNTSNQNNVIPISRQDQKLKKNKSQQETKSQEVVKTRHR